MITATEYLFGQNWVEQYRSALRDQHPWDVVEWWVGNSWHAIDRSLRWCATPQGQDVWFGRHQHMRSGNCKLTR